MHKAFIAFLWAAVVGTIVSCSDKNEYVVEAKLANLPFEPMYVIHDYFRGNLRIDTIEAVSDFFQIKGSSESLAQVDILKPDRTLLMRLYLRNGDDVKLEGDADKPEEIKVSGNSVNAELGTFSNGNSQVLARIREAEKSYGITSDIRSYYATLKQWRDSLYTGIARYVKDHPESPASALLVYQYLLDDVNYNRCDSLFRMISGEAKSDDIQARIELFIAKAKSTGVQSQLPGFSFRSNNDSLLYSSVFRGKPTVLTCWSTEDEASIKELKSQREWYRNADRKKFNLVSVSLDLDSVGWKQRIKTDSLAGKQVRVPEGWNDSWVGKAGITRLPYTLVIDEFGIIQARNIYGKDLEDYVLKLLQDAGKTSERKK